jgi:cytochrome c-type biogenesis protein CcmF
MIGVIGKILIDLAFVCCLVAGVGYFLYARNGRKHYFRLSSWLFAAEGVLIVCAAGLLLRLILTHQFQYYYVFNYTSRSLPLKYLISAFWGGQAGSFLLWIFFTVLVGLSLIKWTRKPYRGPVMFFLVLTQAFLLTMILGVHVGGINIGSSPFKTLAEAMPNAPFILTNPHFTPADGNGLNALLQSPWMVIHPPILFLGFSLMSVPFCFAMAALWRKKFFEWIKPALPWTLGANLCLLFALFLGAYWAYTTLSFGGFWAWDPVENAALVPLLMGLAGIHIMIVQKKNGTTQKASIVFALLAYMGIVYETFLTRSGILGSSSVHSFVDLGLYNQLLVFMLVMLSICIGLFAWRYKYLPKKQESSHFLTREFLNFSGAMILFVLGLVIAIGTSSPIIGRLFESNPTPPNISFYNNWSYPLAVIAAIMTVIGQYVFWRRQDNVESLAKQMIIPVFLAFAAAFITILAAHITHWFPIGLLLAGWFAAIGNATIVIYLLRKDPGLVGGSFAHVGFGVLLLGIIASTYFSHDMLDNSTRSYNAAVAKGSLTDNNGKLIRQKAHFVQLKLDQPKVIDGKYQFIYLGYTMQGQSRMGQQQYTIQIKPLNGSGAGITMHPQVYPLSSVSPGGKINWSIDTDVHPGFTHDIYLYVAGSSYAQRINKEIARRNKKRKLGRQASAVIPADSTDSTESLKITLKKGETLDEGAFEIKLKSFQQTSTKDLPKNTMVAVRADVKIRRKASMDAQTIHPLFAIYSKNGKNWSYSPPNYVKGEDVSFQFTNIHPKTGSVTFLVKGINKAPKKAWILVIAQKKPFISLVWIGTFMVLCGFVLSIFRHRGRKATSIKN